MTTEPRNIESQPALHTLRKALIRLALALSWIGLGAMYLAAVRGDTLGERWIPLVAVTAALIVISFMPWQRALDTPLADTLMTGWAVIAIFGLFTAQVYRDDPPIAAAFALLVFFSAALLISPRHLGIVFAGSMAAYLVLSFGSEPRLAGGEIALRAGILGATGLTAIAVRLALQRQTTATDERLETLETKDASLASKEVQLEQMYDLARTIGTGGNISDVVHDLIGRIVSVLDTKVGLVLLYDQPTESLEVMTPIWVSGHTVRAEEYFVPLDRPSFAQRVFVSSAPGMINDVPSADRLTDPLLEDLDAQRVAAVPLGIETRQIGVLLVADKSDGDFTTDDVDQLQVLGGPAALVLNQMTRFEKAQEEGARAEELAQLKTDFVSVVSHELRTPLTSIIGSLSTLGRPELAPPDPDARELLATATKQANRLRSLIEDLLVVSRLDNQALPVRPTQVDLESFLSDAVASIPGTRGTVAVIAEHDIAKVETDPEHLQRVVINLVDNALKYAPGSPVEVVATSTDHEARIAIIDHGPGIPYELHRHIFERFTQLERSQTRAQGGTGLGLSIVRGLTETLGGRVWFEPTVGGGATFVVSLPLRAAVYGRNADVSSHSD